MKMYERAIHVAKVVHDAGVNFYGLWLSPELLGEGEPGIMSFRIPGPEGRILAVDHMLDRDSPVEVVGQLIAAKIRRAVA